MEQVEGLLDLYPPGHMDAGAAVKKRGIEIGKGAKPKILPAGDQFFEPCRTPRYRGGERLDLEA